MLDDAEMLKRDFEKARKAKEREEKLSSDPQRKSRENALVAKISDIFRSREVSFFDAFQDIYDPLKKDNFVTISKFKEKIKTLNLPLTVQDHRILRRMADPGAIGKVNINDICEKFDTIDLRKLRVNKVLDQVATAFFIQNFNLKKAFQLFDQNGDGLLSRREIREGFSMLKLGLSYHEIDDLISIMSSRPDGNISYDDFIIKMDASIKHRHSAVDHNIEEILLKKVKDCLDYSGESLKSMLEAIDINDTGSIDREELARVFKRIGLSTIDKNIPRILSIGGVNESQEKVNIEQFTTRFMKVLNAKITSAEFEKKMFIHKVHSMIKLKELSLFDVFVRMDVNCSGSLTKLEMKTGIQALGIVITSAEMEMLWKSVCKAKKSENQDKEQAQSWKSTSLD